MSLLQEIQNLSSRYAEEVIRFRRHLHQHPELSYQEFETSKFIQSQLQSFGLTPTSIAGTGLLVLIEGKNPGKKTVALRADIDALPITETNQVPYRSVNAV
jgi:Metal-dependent amidase/aminoacylase/carboxypeptidase